MSFSGNFTPLGINALSDLDGGIGLAINQAAKSVQGDWTPTGYTAGSLVNQTVLSSVTAKIKLAFTSGSSSYRNMLTIGSGICPALGNSRPTTFKPTYPGHGSWTGTTLNSDSYPPKNYPVSPTYSYIHSLFGDYAWVTAWPWTPPALHWQKPTDSYKAATINTAEYDEYFSDGFIATVARQAYYETWSDGFNRINNIVSSFTQADNFKRQQNSKIGTLVNSKTFMSGLYSNTNDIATSDISGVNQAFKAWGTDLITSGRSIDLSRISKFGLPSTLLRTIYKNRVVTDPLKLAMLRNLSSIDVNNILNNQYVPTISQEKKLYDSFLEITGNDLHSQYNGILYGLNCKTVGIETLADLLDPKKLFPNSYKSLTVPEYSLTSERAKVYYFIYRDTGVNSGKNGGISGYGDYLSGILSEDLALSCGAFASAMCHIKNVSNMDIEKFSQVVANLELPSLNLTSIDVPGNTPVAIQSVDAVLSKVALGSGNGNSFKQCDLFGAASGYPYIGYYTIVQRILQQLPTAALNNIYTTMPVTTDVEISLFVTAANTEIANIYKNNKILCDELNYYWDLIGNQLAIEQRAIPLCIPNSTSISTNEDTNNIYSFISRVEEYALDTSDGQSAPTLEALCDITTFGGQNLIAMMREARNGRRLVLAGGDLQNNISSDIDTTTASGKVILTNGVVTGVTVTNPSTGYLPSNPPTITVYPVGGGAKLSAVLAQDGSINNINVENGGSGYLDAQIEISPPPQSQTPVTSVQANYADTPQGALVPVSLLTQSTSSQTVDSAINDVETCNCDCWN